MPACAPRGSSQRSDKRLMRGFCTCFENFQSKVIHAKKTVSKSVHVRPHGVQRRSLGAVAKCACVQSKWAFLGAPTSDRSAVFASASKRFQTKRSSKKDRVQNRALTRSWRSELAERLRGQHRYTLLQRRNCSSRCRIFARKKASLVQGCTCTGYSRTHKGKKCAPASELMLLSKACWRCCARAAKYQPATIHKEKRRRMAARAA